MLKKTILLLSIPILAVHLEAQDISVITNTINVYSENPINGSARYNALAGSVGALGGDISTVNVNPAGIGVFIANDLSMTLGIYNNKNTATLAGRSVGYTMDNTDLSNAGGVLTFNVGDRGTKWKFVNIGVSYTTRSLDNYVESAANPNIIITSYPLYATPVDYSYRGHAYNRYGDVSKANFTVGANYDNRWFFGAGLNFHDSFLGQDDAANFQNKLTNAITTFNKQYTSYEEHSDGFSANIGVIAKLSNEFRVGLAIETPTWWNIDRIYSQYYKDDSYYDVFVEDRELTTPMKATLSAAFVPNKNFALNVDYIQGITKPKYDEYGAAERELNDFFSDSYKNSSEFRVGAEYRLDAFRLRAGYAYQSNSFDNLSLLAYNDDGSKSKQSFSDLLVGERNTIGAGIGYDFKAFYIDASYQNISSKYKSPSLFGVVTDPNYYTTSGYYNPSGTELLSDAYAVSKVKNNRNNFFLTVGWRF